MEYSTKRKKYDETRTTPLNIVYNSCKKDEKKMFLFLIVSCNTFYLGINFIHKHIACVVCVVVIRYTLHTKNM